LACSSSQVPEGAGLSTAQLGALAAAGAVCGVRATGAIRRHSTATTAVTMETTLTCVVGGKKEPKRQNMELYEWGGFGYGTTKPIIQILYECQLDRFYILFSLPKPS